MSAVPNKAADRPHGPAEAELPPGRAVVTLYPE